MNKQDSTGSSSNNHLSSQKLSCTSCSSPIIPTPTPSEEQEPEDNILMETGESGKAAAEGEAANNLQTKQETPPLAAQDAGSKDAKFSLADTRQKSKVEKMTDKKGKRTVKKSKRKEASSDSEASSEASTSDSDSSDSSEDEKAKRKKKKKLAAKKAAAKKTKQKAREKAKKKSKKYESSDDSSSDSDSDLENDKIRRKKKKAKAKKKKKSIKYASSSEESSSSSSSSSSSETDSEAEKKERARHRRARLRAKAKSARRVKAVETDSSTATSSESEAESTPTTSDTGAPSTSSGDETAAQARLKAALAQLKLEPQQLGLASAANTLKKAKSDTIKTDDKPQRRKKNALEFKRVDQVWDSKIRDYKYTESVEEQKDVFDSVFTVRRRFGWDNKYIETQVDIKSKLLRSVLQVIFKDCKSISLVEDKPSIQPHMLFHYYDEIKMHVKKTLKPRLKKAKKKKDKKQLTQQIAQTKLLIRYIDEDYEETRKTLKPMLKVGTITYTLVWALFKPNTIIYTPTYGNKDDPRCFKVDYCYEEEDWFGNRKWNVEGRYLEYDGKVFGLGDHFVQINAFKGPKKITNLAAYPLNFHKDPDNLREQLIERGKKFVALQGMNYRVHKGLGYMKVKRSIAKININGRVMIDPAIFRRINPNYPLSYIKQDELGQDDVDSDDDSDEGCCSDSEANSDDEKPKRQFVMWKDKLGKKHSIYLPVRETDEDITAQKLDGIEDEGDEVNHVFTEEELLIASPVVLGFTFSEKLWLEFSLSGIEEIEWNDEAFGNLVISQQTKQNLKGLVSSHRFNAAKTIDDVIVGKGKGLNVVLHGPPGVGKTLTGESIAEYLRCPLYAVSSGELGTNAAQLERDLNRIMDITHSWGAILLLDEADVFLEARQPHDIHRNALVSVFLRLTEYYQGILFLTTNRVSTFDEAFQSRIHMGIRYENLTAKARKKIWQHHVGKVLQMADKDEAQKCRAFVEDDYDELSKKIMNGRQIKNAVKTSQAIAISEKGIFGMEYVKRVMEAHETFEEDMKGGRGYRDAMRQYT